MGKFALIFLAFAGGEFIMRSMAGGHGEEQAAKVTDPGHSPFIDESIDITAIGRVEPNTVVVPEAHIPHLKFMYCIG
jgi:hypothetical protein